MFAQSNASRLANLLKIVCKDPDNCIALGPYDEYIKTFFNDFIIASENSYYNLTIPPYDIEPNKLIMGDGSNSFVIKVPFKRLDYVAYSVLKCAKIAKSDNLMYEYVVGKFFINNYIKKLPCFVETYNLYEINDNINLTEDTQITYEQTIALLQNIQPIQFRLENIQEHFKDSCVKNKRLCLEIQHFNQVKTLNYMMKHHYNEMKYDENNILYQVYYALCVLGNKYTHYDIHTNNILLYVPYEGKQCILMRYHTGDKVLEFKTNYIAKIIDYGRNYFNNGTISTADIINNYICNVPECEPNGSICGSTVGYSIIKGENTPGDFYWINPTTPNISHDLKLIKHNQQANSNNIVSGILYETPYGTPECIASQTHRICNIYHLKDYYDNIMTLEKYNKNVSHRKYNDTWKIVATMNIYDDGRDYEYKILA